MAVLPICLFPDPILRKRARPVSSASNRELERFLADFLETLFAQPGGIGIAAPQVGEGRQIAIVDVSSKDSSKDRLILINPEILEQEGEVLSREGCMSLPDYTANVKRASRIVITWTDEHGRRHQKSTSGIEAICMQHEVDHLNGVLFIDRVASLKTDVFPRKKRR